MNQIQAVHKIRDLDRKFVTILGVTVDSNSKSSLLRKIQVNITSGHKFFIVTPNPEHLMKALEDEEFKDILNRADYSIPDGIGLVAAYKFLNLPNPRGLFLRFFTLLAQGMGVGFSVLFDRDWLEEDLKRIHGRELFMDLVKIANKKSWKLYFLGGEGNEADKAKKILERNYLNLKIKARRGPMLFDDGNPRNEKEREEEERTVRDINDFSPDLLFIGFGAPKQEKWLYRYFNRLKIGGAMVHGGTFRYISGQAKLPPDFIDNLGLEWLWRLLTGSQKRKRIWTAITKFPLKIFLIKFSSKN